MNETQIADNMIDENFTKSNLVALVVPKNDDYRVEAAMIKELESHDEVDHTRGLSNIEAMDGYMLEDRLTSRQFSEMAGLDYELAQVVYTGYALEMMSTARSLATSPTTVCRSLICSSTSVTRSIPALSAWTRIRSTTCMMPRPRC